MSEKIRALIVDDHATARLGTTLILNSFAKEQVVGQAKNGVEALKWVIDRRPSVMLLEERPDL